MKATGIVRRVDDLGRLVVPVELRRTLGIESGDPLEVYVEGESVIFKKYEPACIFCGEAGNTMEFKDKVICYECLETVKKEE